MGYPLPLVTTVASPFRRRTKRNHFRHLPSTRVRRIKRMTRVPQTKDRSQNLQDPVGCMRSRTTFPSQLRERVRSSRQPYPRKYSYERMSSRLTSVRSDIKFSSRPEDKRGQKECTEGGKGRVKDGTATSLRVLVLPFLPSSHEERRSLRSRPRL